LLAPPPDGADAIGCGIETPRTPLNRSIDMLFNGPETARRAILMRERRVDTVSLVAIAGGDFRI